jgi:uncharacterized protein (TIGR02246 family)
MPPRTLRRLFVSALLVSAAACAPAAPPDTRARDEAAIREADAAFSAAASAKDIEAILGFYADDAVTMPPNAPASSGKDAIRKEFETMLAMPGMTLSWQASGAVAAGSSDIGYSWGTAQFGMTGPDGAAMSDTLKYVTIWRKQADGSWKVVVDIFNSNSAPPAPAAPAAGSGS